MLRTHIFRGAVLSLVVVLSACGGGNAGSDTAASGGASPAAAPDSTVQTVTGKAPAAVGEFPAIVILEPIGGGPAQPQAAPPAMDQEQQTFIPSILLVQTGQPVEFQNHDDVLHNVRVKDDETKESAFNVAIPNGEKYVHTFKKDGFYDVGCDIHPGMSAQIVASASPWKVIADAAGNFTIGGVPNGPYKATVYAGAQKIEKEVSVGAGSATLDLTHP